MPQSVAMNDATLSLDTELDALTERGTWMPCSATHAMSIACRA